jgi:MFS family permease
MAPAVTTTLCPSPRKRKPKDAAPEPRLAEPAQPIEPRVAYGSAFWWAYLSNVLAMTGVALLFRYADFITMLGGTEFHLGWIVGIGMVGSLVMRLVLGTWMDRHGAAMLWFGSIFLFAATCLAHLAVTTPSGVAIYALRIAYCCAVAGLNGASVTFVSARAPDERVAEVVGVLGTGGFLATVVGTMFGDYLLGSIQVAPSKVALMFVVAGGLSIVALPFAWIATRGERQTREIALRLKESGTTHNESSLLTILRRYNPGSILIVVVAVGVVLGLPSTFLRSYAANIGIPRIGLFFFAYAVAAIVIRIPTRRWAERFGPRRIIIAGTLGSMASLLLLLPVSSEWQLLIPAVAFGCSHGILFPSLVAAGSVSFPSEHRGLATILILAAWDLGILVGSPMAGAVVKYSESFGLAPYPTMFISIAGLVGLTAVWYAIVSRNVTPAADAEPVLADAGSRTTAPLSVKPLRRVG